MNQEQAGIVLAKCSAFDNRKPSLAVAQAWSEALDPSVTMPDALAIVVAHYAQSRDWIMPVDINRESRRIQRERLEAVKASGAIDPPSEIQDGRAYADWKQAAVDAIKRGASRSQAEAHAWAVIGQSPPALEPTTNHHHINISQIGQTA